MVSHFLTSVHISDDFHTKDITFLKGRQILEKNYPLGWAFFREDNIAVILKELGPGVEFSDIQASMQYVYQTKGRQYESKFNLDLMKDLNQETISRYQLEVENKKNRQNYYNGYRRQPVIPRLIRNPIRASSRDFRSLEAHRG